MSSCVCLWTPQCSDNLAFCQPRQILILRGMPLPMSFLCLSPSYHCHIPSLLFFPPLSSSHPDCPPWDGNYNSVDTLTPQGPLCAFFCPAASVSLSVSLLCLPVSACFCLAVFLSTLQSISFCLPHSALQYPWVSLSLFCPTTNCPYGSFCTFTALSSSSFYCFLVYFFFSFPQLLQTFPTGSIHSTLDFWLHAHHDYSCRYKNTTFVDWMSSIFNVF